MQSNCKYASAGDILDDWNRFDAHLFLFPSDFLSIPNSNLPESDASRPSSNRLLETMSGKSSACAICEGSNLPSICAVCVNRRLHEYYDFLRTLKNRRASLYSRVEEDLKKKKKAEDRDNWRVLQNEKLVKLKSRLQQLEKQLSEGKAKRDRVSNDLKENQEMLDSAFSMLKKKRVDLLEKFYPNLIYTQNLGLMAITSECIHKQSVLLKQICKLFPIRRVNSESEKNSSSRDSYDQICNARLPKGLDPHSVPSEHLAASLGYMVQLLNLVVPILGAPALHNSGFAGSCSRIWQRNSYWDTRPLSRSDEFPLFIPRQNLCTTNDENSWSDRSSSNFGVASVESERKPCLDAIGSFSFNYSSASPHSMEIHKDLQKGISLLKKSVACITTYCYNSLGLNFPCDMSTFEVFGKLLATLSSSKEVRSIISLKMTCTRSNKQVPKTGDKSVWHMNSDNSSCILVDSVQTPQTVQNVRDNNMSYSAGSFFFTPEMAASRKPETLVDGWDIVEHPKFPPPPSQLEDVEHWARAMFIDATKH